jgi:amidohydrolase
MAALLGAAAILKDEEGSGRLGFRPRLIFQPGEEGHFGALGMIEGGALDGLCAIEGGHVGDLSEELGPGEAGFIPGPMMAASDSFEASFIGSGGHGSAPHHSPDPIAAFADFVQALAQFRARELDQRQAAVISICQVRAGGANNVIPERLDLGGTARSLDKGLRRRLERRIGEIGAATAKLWRLDFEYKWLGGYPPLVNDPASTEAIEKAARAVLGNGRIKRLTAPIMGGEDFAFYAERVPAAFWFLNSQAPDRGICHPNHNPRFDLDEACLADAALLHLASAQALAGTEL